MFGETVYLADDPYAGVQASASAETPGGLTLIPPGSPTSNASSDCFYNCYDGTNESTCLHQCASVGGYMNTLFGSNLLRRIFGGGTSGDPALAAEAKASYGPQIPLLPDWWPIAAIGIVALVLLRK